MCECYQVGGRFIAEDPDCPEHGEKMFQVRAAPTGEDWFNTLPHTTQMELLRNLDKHTHELFYETLNAAFEAGRQS